MKQRHFSTGRNPTPPQAFSICNNHRTMQLDEFVFSTRL